MISPDDLSLVSRHLTSMIHFLLFPFQYNFYLPFSDFGLPYFLPIIFLATFLRLRGKTSSPLLCHSTVCFLEVCWSPSPNNLDPWSIWLLWLCICPDLVSISFISHTDDSPPVPRKYRLHSSMRMEKGFFLFFTTSVMSTKEQYSVSLQQNMKIKHISFQFSFFLLSPFSPPSFPFQSDL